jgi:beta-glucuronidase
MDYVMWNEYYETWVGGTTEVDMARNLDEIHRVFPDKPVVISEYGWCSCTVKMTEDDAKRVDLLRRQDAVFRRHDYIAGLIYFCYNDFRTQMGHEGLGAMKQRGGGVVDLYGNRKPSWSVLCDEASPIEALEVLGAPEALTVMIKSRNAIPSYTLDGYKLRSITFGTGDVPLERREAAIKCLAPGETVKIEWKCEQKGIVRIQFDVLRPTGYSVFTFERR